MRGLFFAIIAMTVSACGPRPLTPVEFAGLEAPPGTVVLSEDVDQMIVGDRLMDSGEFELALRAYYRAGVADGVDADLLNAIGLANLSLGRLGQAEDTFRAALNDDDTHVPALNNLGVVLIERGEIGEARRIFEQAFALDSGRSDSIRDNLRFAIAQMENTVYDAGRNPNGPGLIRRGGGVYTLERGQ